MQDKIIILKNTVNGIVGDTIISVNDTLRLDLKQEFLLPKEDIFIHTISEPLTVVEKLGLWIGIVLAVVTIIYTLYSIYKLRQSDKDTQLQLNELKGIIGAIEAQNAIATESNTIMTGYFAELQNLLSTGSGSSELAVLEQKRFRLSVKPRLYINSSGYAGYSGEIHIGLNNRGELAYYDGYEFLEGTEIEIQNWKNSVEIPKDGRIQLQGRTLSVHPKNLVFKIKIHYHDQEDFKYESIIEWNKSAKIIETVEL
ncbi:hypothetical protein [Leeuwenhoekiella aestuarii]|uniref:Uncharacterized protein n=1 Tax=Leeuwenhoekiella aestuarii TaxID=2249426 RepID=A0A4Q0NYU6_9FLAO|nr:hypothetical protein [Leeuwenhoekiella aestuarii]RXG17987.1 hypothetical protein DSM04_101173 [Leeuwenhoekiella aestuarii]